MSVIDSITMSAPRPDTDSGELQERRLEHSEDQAEATDAKVRVAC
jgi:hypothetical protein